MPTTKTKQRPVKVAITKLSEKVKVQVIDNCKIEVYSTVSRVLPMFNNIGNEVEISATLTKNTVTIPTGVQLETETGGPFVPHFMLDPEIFDKSGVKVYNINIADGELTLELQNLGNKKFIINEGQKLGKIILMPILEFDYRTIEFEEEN